jgi:hypothetical protein
MHEVEPEPAHIFLTVFHMKFTVLIVMRLTDMGRVITFLLQPEEERILVKTHLPAVFPDTMIV